VSLTRIAGPLAAFTASLTAACSPPKPKVQPADVVIVSGKVWTANGTTSEAIAIRGEDIAYVGDTAGATAYVGPNTQRFDGTARLVVPGFNDAHIHLLSGSEGLTRIDLLEVAPDLASVQKAIGEFAKQNAGAEWVLGRGWLYSTFPGGLPTKDQLDAAVGDRPAYMECYDGHSGWANSKALALAGITKNTKDPVNGAIVRDPKTGEPTGALKEAATSLVEKAIPRPTVEERYALLLRAFEKLSSQGITSAQDMGYGAKSIADAMGLVDRASREGKQSVRLQIGVVMSEDDYAEAIAAAKQQAARPQTPLLRTNAMKGFVDGVIEAHTGAMLAPYANDKTSGVPNWKPANLDTAVTAADKEGIQVHLHAIGDRGVRMALDAFQAAEQANGPRDRRDRIEHIETIDAADYPRFKALGVIASMQPLHADPNGNLIDVWAVNAGPERAARGFSWQNLQKAGAMLNFGSDWPVVTADVFRGLHAAVTRTTREGTPAGGWHKEQAVGIEDALRHYTIDAAYGEFADKDKGSLEVGKKGDLVVLSDDLLASGPEQILKTKVLLTVMNGKVVYRDPAFGPTR
jgi:predicted amidohydrolase YtcJ